MALPHKKIQTNPEPDLPWNQPDENGFYHIDDMLLNEFQFKQQFGSTEEENAQTRNAIADEMLKWPNGQLKFFFMDSVTDAQKQQVRSAYTKFNSIFEGCLKINEIAPTNLEDTNVVFLTNYDRSGCFSAIGRQGYYQQLNLGKYCFNYHSVIHEFLHAFGVYHVQSRPDRDQYVDIVWDNIYESLYFNYKRQDNALTYNVPYDGRSFMHYRAQTNFNIEYMEPSIISKVNPKLYIFNTSLQM